MRFATDMCIVELVDDDNQPVADGTPSAKVLVTNLHNHTQPLIRYELTDRFIRHPADGDAYLHATAEGRADEAFRYGTITVDALMIRTVMVQVPNVAEYQVRQTDNGVDVAIIAEGVLDDRALAASLERMLRSAGVSDPRVHVHKVAAIPRLPHSGKTRRFIPMTTAPMLLPEGFSRCCPQPGYRSGGDQDGAGDHPRPAPLHGPGRPQDIEHDGRGFAGDREHRQPPRVAQAPRHADDHRHDSGSKPVKGGVPR
jgi:hypothetical protein